ncbi:MAG: hypothetical protein C0625_11385 [Arcobacter sp.]|nr:MAG: hypothetical protein C0625_11385 [Arcobacter sp.]
MSLDLLIPFGILIVLVVYLIYSRSRFENDIVSLYDKKFDEWKDATLITNNNEEKKVCKELVGLVFKEEYNITIELLDDSVSSPLQRGKFSIKDK